MESGFISTHDLGSTSEWNRITCKGSGRYEFFIVRRFGALHFVKRPSEAYRHDLVTTESLKKEFNIGYNLSHPSIVRYLSMDDGAVFEEYVDGLSLREMMDKGDSRLQSPEFIERICRQLLDAVAYLHSRGVIHNDVKPENVMVSRIDNQLKLVDLGCAYTDMWDATQGYTPGYKAPEQGGGETNVYTDIYLIGKLMEELASIAGDERRWRKFVSRATAEKVSDRFASDVEAIAAIPRQKSFFRQGLVGVALLLILGSAVFSIIRWFRTDNPLLESQAVSQIDAASPVEDSVGIISGNGEVELSAADQMTVLPYERPDGGESGNEGRFPKGVGGEENIEKVDGERMFLYDGVKYVEMDPANREVCVFPATSKEGYKGDIVIHSEVEVDNVRYKVTGIEKGAFYECDNLESLVIEDGPTEIKDKTIESTSLKRLTIPGSVKRIENVNACDLEELIFSGDGVQEISGLTYSPNLLELHLPNSVRSISGMDADRIKAAGLNGYRIKRISFGNKVEEILHSFKIYPGESLVLPPGCHTILASFLRCDNLRTLQLGNVGHLEGFCYVDRLERLIIPSSCREVGECGNSAKNLKYLQIGSGVEKIYNSFGKMDALESLTIPANCKDIRQSFNRLRNLKELMIENGVERIEDSFSYLPQLKRLTIPGSCKVVKGFGNLPELEELIIGEGVEVIEGFTNIDKIKKIVLPKSVRSVDMVLKRAYEKQRQP